MFEDSLIESGGRFRSKRGNNYLILVCAPTHTDWHFGVVALNFHRGIAPAATDDLPGCASASTPTAASTGR